MTVALSEKRKTIEKVFKNLLIVTLFSFSVQKSDQLYIKAYLAFMT